MSEDKHSGNNGDDDWDAYLVVGGIRPGPMPHKSSSPTVEDKALESESNKSVDSDEAESTSNDGDSTDDDSDEAKFGTAASLTISPYRISRCEYGNQQLLVTQYSYSWS
eukprot:scaffold6164_cov89-Skeletonema_dohrnii-CCMP3373.AAC.1